MMILRQAQVHGCRELGLMLFLRLRILSFKLCIVSEVHWDKQVCAEEERQVPSGRLPFLGTPFTYGVQTPHEHRNLVDPQCMRVHQDTN